MIKNKSQKFQLSVIVNFGFFIIFIFILLSSAFWFYNSSLKSIQNETNNSFKQSNKLIEVMLDSYANNLSDFTRQVVNKHDFELNRIQNDDSVYVYLSDMFNSSIDNKLDFMFLKLTSGRVIDVSLSLLDTDSIIKTISKNSRDKVSYYEEIVTKDQVYATLVTKQDVIDSDTGRFLGELYAGIVLNDNISILEEIYSKLEITSLSFILKDNIIASSSLQTDKLYNKIKKYSNGVKSNKLTISNDFLIKRSKIKIKDEKTTLEVLSITSNEVFKTFQDDFMIKLMVLFIFIVTLFAITYRFTKMIIEVPLKKLMLFASNSIYKNRIEEFEESRIEEFNLLGKKFEKLILKIKNMNRGLELKIKDRTTELEESNDELQVTIENLKNTQDKLVEVEKMASLGNLVAGVAHEINTPVGICLTGSTHLERICEDINTLYKNDDMSQSDFENFLKQLNELSSSLTINLTKGADLIRSFKQVAVDQTSEKKRLFDVNEYTQQILFSLKNVLRQSSHKININCNDDILINSYPGAYSQIITNLIINSINHAFTKENSGEININIDQEENRIFINYNDNGKGINEEDLSKIFDPFFTTSREHGGTGLGLPIVYNIITTIFKGNVECTSILGEGVEFNIVLEI